MARHTVLLEVEVTITTTDEGEAGIDRYVDLPVENEWHVTPGMDKGAVLLWLARTCAYGYSNDASQDGFADLDRDSIQTTITDVQEAF